MIKSQHNLKDQSLPTFACSPMLHDGSFTMLKAQSSVNWRDQKNKNSKQA